MFGAKKRIRIEFFDVETGQMIGFDEKKPKQIPPTFRFDTHVQIRGKMWKLVEAEPFDRKKFLKSGLLTIKLRLEEDAEESSLPPIPEKEQLYRSPSRPSSYPESGGSKKGKILEMRKSEWRAIELISQRFRTEISREMGKIEEIRATASTEQNGAIFYRSQHVRDLPTDLVEMDGIPPSALKKDWFPFANAYDGVKLMSDEGSATQTFSLGLPAGIALYGQLQNGKIQCIGLVPAAEKHKLIGIQDIERLVRFMEENGLVMVDWDNLKFLEPIVSVMEKYFSLPEESAKEGYSSSPLSRNLGDTVILEEPELEKPIDQDTTAPPADESAGIAEEDLLFTAHVEAPSQTLPNPADDSDLLDLRIDHSLESKLPDSETPQEEEE